MESSIWICIVSPPSAFTTSSVNFFLLPKNKLETCQWTQLNNIPDPTGHFPGITAIFPPVFGSMATWNGVDTTESEKSWFYYKSTVKRPPLASYFCATDLVVENTSLVAFIRKRCFSLCTLLETVLVNLRIVAFALWSWYSEILGCVSTNPEINFSKGTSGFRKPYNDTPYTVDCKKSCKNWNSNKRL